MNGLKHPGVLITDGACFIGSSVVHCLPGQNKCNSLVGGKTLQHELGWYQKSGINDDSMLARWQDMMSSCLLTTVINVPLSSKKREKYES